jgi:hypothetical protein
MWAASDGKTACLKVMAATNGPNPAQRPRDAEATPLSLRDGSDQAPAREKRIRKSSTIAGRPPFRTQHWVQRLDRGALSIPAPGPRASDAPHEKTLFPSLSC